ncbi:MAG: 30S ribosomal protein S12 methylthiotransferase RimO [Sedimentisphaerales bacterium]|nr:30S ribosomal protein S12 methylthiotransferase RimO [Sedimentisphaerales bacterium]
MSKRKNKTNYTVGFIALGCPKNIVDSEKMLALIGTDDFILTNNICDADIVVVNTCGFIEPAKVEALESISYAVELKKKGKVKKVIVAGCLSQRMGDKLHDEAEGIDAIVTLEQRDNIAKIIRDVISSDKIKTYNQQTPSTIHNDAGRLLITPPHWAYLRISEGCSRKCSFCTIPSIRGAFRSKPLEMVLAEAHELVDNGAVELSIIAQDSSNYGKDLGIKDGLIKLINNLQKIDSLEWIRLMYLYPANISDYLVDIIAQSEKVVNYIDMPVQHINDQILKAMKRTDTKEKTMRLIEKLRHTIDNVVLRTTVIAGFPDETDQIFDELLDFIKWARFDVLGCFPYYPEAGTMAAQLKNQLSADTKNARTEKLMLTQQKIAFEKAGFLKGKRFSCLIDDIDENGTGTGRYFGQAPHIDSVCLIENCPRPQGRFVEVEITGTKNYDLTAKTLL